jgi:histone H3/H4
VKRKGKYSIFKLDDRNVFPKPTFIRLKKEIIQKLKYQKMLELAGKEIEELRKKILVETFYDRLTQEEK